MITPVDQVFTHGENATLTCISMGGPNNVYQWEKDGNVVATDDILTLMDIDASSGGIYTCTVSNLAGNDSATTTLYVAPYFVIHPGNVETSNSSVFARGERITLNVSEEMVNVTNHLSGVVYNFTVIAYNDIRNSIAGETTPLSTLEEGENILCIPQVWHVVYYHLYYSAC